MSKRIIALILCLIMLVPLFSACGKKQANDVGAYITMYLTDEIYDFDPANAFYNTDTKNVVSLLFDTLFKLDDKGRVKGSLVKEYSIEEDEEKGEYSMTLTLNNAKWSNGAALTSFDVLYAWKRLLNPSNNYQAASLLFDIKNARAIRNGELTVDHLQVMADENNVVTIFFEGKIDYDQFLLNLTSLATAPLLEAYVEKNPDWAKKASTLVTSGPFKVGKTVYEDILDEDGYNVTVMDDNALNDKGEIKVQPTNNLKRLRSFFLERNSYYDRDTKRERIDSSVTSYRLLVDCSRTAEEIEADYKDGKLFYIGNIPVALRASNGFELKQIKTSNALSTFVCYLNEKALISDGGEGTYLFANSVVRKALSLAIDRKAIADAVVYADAATGLVPTGVFDTTRKTSFREAGGAISSVATDPASAAAQLDAAGITDRSKYSFSIKVPSYDDASVMMAEMIAAAWGTDGLGFNVTVEEVTPIQNNDYYKETDSVPPDVCDDLFVEAIQRGKFEVIAFDYVAYTADAYSMLSSFALPFSGTAMNIAPMNNVYETQPHVTGYNNEQYNNLMEAIYYLPYFAGLTENSTDFLGIYKENPEEFKTLYNAIKAIYAENGITPSKRSADWAEQKAILLHKAEQMLLDGGTVIPVVFNQNAVVISDELTKVNTDYYYFPAYFRKTGLKDYAKYIPALENFPTIDWELVVED